MTKSGRSLIDNKIYIFQKLYIIDIIKIYYKNSGRKPPDCIWGMNPALGGRGSRCENAKTYNRSYHSLVHFYH